MYIICLTETHFAVQTFNLLDISGLPETETKPKSYPKFVNCIVNIVPLPLDLGIKNAYTLLQGDNYVIISFNLKFENLLHHFFF